MLHNVLDKSTIHYLTTKTEAQCTFDDRLDKDRRQPGTITLFESHQLLSNTAILKVAVSKPDLVVSQ
ncbi:MAG: hypothetical protein C0482_18435 [Gordonia sp.]|nr:hypothetical protein [Gordonia sp. (in: high G+C Gram-positive bacteria)]